MVRHKGSSSNAVPVLKWAGGKGQLLPEFELRFPEGLKNGDIQTYLEPFVGGGAVFFHIALKYPVKRNYLLDINEDLVLTYNVIKNYCGLLVTELKKLEENYLKDDEIQREKKFYEIRNEFNKEKSTFNYSVYNNNWIHRASQILFLNKTCFNGLYRVNSKGEFNVPFGKYKNPVICNELNLKRVSVTFSNVIIRCGDYLECEICADENTFVYLDPPYRPLNKSAFFASYAKDGFSDIDQKRLAELFKRLDKKGAKVMLSNSDPKNENPDDTFFDSLYEGYFIDRVPAKRAINSNGSRRGEINEIIVMNYEAPRFTPRNRQLTLQ